MVNYKRKKCRYKGKDKQSRETFIRKRLSLKPIRLPDDWSRNRNPEIKEWPSWCSWGFLGNYPRSWDIVFHTRPRRRAETRCLNLIKQGSDPENMAWPLEKKPHQYYW